MPCVRPFLVASFALLCAAPALADWSPSGNAVCTAPGFQGDLFAIPVAFSSPGFNGNSMFVVWSDARDSIPAVSDVYRNGVGVTGDVSDANGQAVIVAPAIQNSPCAAISGPGLLQGSNAVAVAWTDTRNGAYDVYARQTQFDWPGGIVPVCTAPGAQFSVQMCNDGVGVILAWLDERDGFDAVYAQRLDSNGAPVWTANGAPVCTVPATRSGLRLVRRPTGGAYVAWTDDRSGPPRAYAILLDDATGAPAAGWPANGTQVVNFPGSTLDRIVVDATGGIYATMWSSSGHPIAERLDAGGTLHAGWPAAGVVLRQNAIDGTLQDAVVHGTSLAVLWAEDDDPDETVDLNLRAQLLRDDGTRDPAWAADGVIVCDAPGNQQGARMVDVSPFLAVWEDGRSLADGDDVYALRIQADGTRPAEWPANGLLVAGGNGRQFSPRPVVDANGGVLVAYLDDHDFDSFETDVYAQRVTFDGQIGTVGVPVATAGGSLRLGAPVPNPARAAVTLALGGGLGRARAVISDALGRRVRTLESAPGTLRWDLADDAGRRVEPGVYWVHVRAGGAEATRTVIVRR